MVRGRLVGLLLAASLVASSASAQERGQPTHEITYAQALSLARRQGPSLALAQARVGEARGGVDAASVWRLNPQLEGAAGPRFGGATTVDWSVGAQQWIELGGQRGDRVDAARAALDAAEARGEDAERLLLREVALSFVQALYWQRRVTLAEENVALASEVARVARRRHELGDAGGLEASVASLSLTRAQTDGARARAALGQATGRLKVLLGLEAAAVVTVRGDLRQLGMPQTSRAAEVIGRPDLRALDAEVRQAEAEGNLGRASRVPDVALGASYSREEGADIVQGALTVALPIFDHGQGIAAVAGARRARVEAELRGARGRAAIEGHTAAATNRRLSAAARNFEEVGLSTVERAERVATASYEAGAVPLGELLAVRRELVRAKLDYADLLLGAATSRVDLTAIQGAF